MKRTKKTFCSVLAFILCITALGMPVSATAKEKTTETIMTYSANEENHITFSKLFFDNHEDIVKLTEYFSDDGIKSIKDIDINEIISKLDLNTNAEETICILKNIFEINEYV